MLISMDKNKISEIEERIRKLQKQIKLLEHSKKQLQKE